MLKGYLRMIQKEMDLHGNVEPEVEREILLKYFDGYEFEDEEEAIKFFIS